MLLEPAPELGNQTVRGKSVRNNGPALIERVGKWRHRRPDLVSGLIAVVDFLDRSRAFTPVWEHNLR